MSLLELRGIGKIYVSENSVAVGIRGVNLDLDIGEFVAVTGKSGSGKTTLLNCISGMDSYEEGELYINGEPTSHYTQKDWEEYRQKYISFVFQDYNIIDSFTVLQNVELALTHIESHAERRRRALELIDRVGMTQHKNSKGSKLSGGQKQRTVIARALAKDSPIILADEPTGNLDSKTSEEIVELLHEISKDKLVVVVTHSFSQFESAATREVRIFDGSIERDEVMRPHEKGEYIERPEISRRRRDISLGIELGRHKFFAAPKLSVFMCIIMLVAMLGSFFITAMYMADTGYDTTSELFTYREGRLVISKETGGAISDTELKELAAGLSAKSYMHYDYLFERTAYIYTDIGNYNWVNTTLKYAPLDGEKPSVGRVPQSKDECMLVLPICWQPVYGKDTLLSDEITLSGIFNLKVVGVKYYYDNTKPYSYVLLTDEGFDTLTRATALDGNIYATLSPDGSADTDKLSFGGVGIDYSLGEGEFYVISPDVSLVSDMLKKNDVKLSAVDSETYVSFETDISQAGWKFREDLCSETYSVGISYYKDMLVVSADIAYDVSYDLYCKDYTQASLFFDSDRSARAAQEKLDSKGYVGIVSDEKYESGIDAVLEFIQQVLSVIMWVVCILFLGFFLSLCLRRSFAASNGDLAILRSMGISTSIVKISMYARTFMATLPSLIALAVIAPVIYLNPYTNQYIPFMHVQHYAVIVIGIVLLDFIVAYRCNKRIFKGTVIKNLKGGDRA